VIPAVRAGEAVTLLLLERRAAYDDALRALRDEARDEPAMVRPLARGLVATRGLVGYRDDAHGAGAPRHACLFFRPRPGTTLRGVVSAARRGAPWPVESASALVARLARLVGEGRTRFDPLAAGLDEDGVWMLAPELDALLRAVRDDARAPARWLGYVAPEALQGRSRPEHSAMFGLGVLLFELLAGRPLFERRSPLETLRTLAEARAPSLTRLVPGVPVEVAALALALVERDPLVRPSPAVVEASLRRHACVDEGWARALAVPSEEAPFLRML
jgi:hypothetical protein